MVKEYRLYLLLQLTCCIIRRLYVIVCDLSQLRELVALIVDSLVKITVELFIERVLAACFLVALDEHLIACLDEQHLHLDIGLSLQSLPCAEYLREHIACSYIYRNSDFFHARVGLAAEVNELRYKLRRDIIDAVIADILHNVHNARFSRAGHSGYYQ